MLASQAIPSPGKALHVNDIITNIIMEVFNNMLFTFLTIIHQYGTNCLFLQMVKIWTIHYYPTFASEKMYLTYLLLLKIPHCVHWTFMNKYASIHDDMNDILPFVISYHMMILLFSHLMLESNIHILIFFKYPHNIWKHFDKISTCI